MSLPVTVTFMLADWVVKGLANGTLERVGGVIREVGTKQVVAWLREISEQPAQVNQSLEVFQGILNITTAASILNLGVSVMGFAVIAQRLKELERRLQKAQELLNKIGSPRLGLIN
ncbi:hypothetical protein [Nostoc sp. FACHB-280]|uniref:hypothetical protein n=1 Tax=Nostoc sp. FACHB-280 TaxID=2692839 RepID=UPI001F549C5E|nr:hypothetical protein [Nostoc sp. FACHB-280]